MPTIRLATRDDIPALCALGRLMHAESSFAPLDFDPAVLAETIGRLMDARQFVVIAEDEGLPVGGMLGMVIPSFFGRDFVANDIAIFLHPEHRRGHVGARLIRGFNEWAKRAGAKQIRPGVSSGHAGAEKLYAALGFSRVGAIFCMNTEDIA